jgi:hypothetical protein
MSALSSVRPPQPSYGTRRFLPIHAGDVVASSPCALLNLRLAREILVFCADAQIDAGDFDRNASQDGYASIDQL